MIKIILKRVLLVASVLRSVVACADDYEDGLAAFAEENYELAFSKFMLAAGEDNEKAQFNLGFMYANGEGVVQDYQEASKWFRFAAEQGYADAQNNLGLMYGNGNGVIQDYVEALKWWRLAAEQGFSDAQNNLGVLYDNGFGVIQDYSRAHMWWNLSAANGNSDAVKNRDIVAGKMTASQLEKAQELARECVKKEYKGC